MYVRILRWSRLLLGREFKFADTHVLRIWDCLFSADVVDSEEKEGEKEIVKLENREIIPRHIPDVRHGYSIDTSTSSSSSESIFDSKSPSSHPYPEYLSDGSQVQVQSMGSGSAGGYPPMLTALRDFMLAMLIHVSTLGTRIIGAISIVMASKSTCCYCHCALCTYASVTPTLLFFFFYYFYSTT